MSYYPSSVTIPVYAVFTAVGIILTTLRFWTRSRVSKQPLHIDDWLIAIGMVIVCVCTGIQFYNALEGTGGEAISPGDAEKKAVTSYKINFTMIIIEKPAFGAIKLSLLFFFERIFGVWRDFKRANRALMVVIILWTISFATADLLICGTKMGVSWAADQTLAQEHCADRGLLLLMFAATSVITDLLVLCLPFFYIRRLRMPTEKKWGAGLIFALGAMSTAAGVLRTIFLCIAYPMGRMGWGYKPPPASQTPLVLQIFNPTFWVMIEMMLGAWAANLPALAPLIRGMGFQDLVSRIYKKMSSADHTTKGSAKTMKSEKITLSSSTEDLRQNSDPDAVMLNIVDGLA